MQVPLDYPAVAMMLTLAGAINRRARIQPKENDTTWQVVPNLWGAIIGPPGYMKSPVIDAAIRPLVMVERQWRAETDVEVAKYRSAQEAWSIRNSIYKQEMKKRISALKAAVDPGPKPARPVARRLVVNDATPEKLHEIMRDNPAGVFVIRDELTGWLADLDKAGREGERALHLTAWNGDTSFTVDRIKRGSIFVEGCCESILGGIQPEMLKRYLNSHGKTPVHDDGLIQRFQMSVWPDTSHEWEYIDERPDKKISKRLETVIGRIVNVDPTSPVLYAFSVDAQTFFIDWLTNLESVLRNGKLPPVLVSHLSKYRKLMPAIALICALAERASRGSVGSVGFVGSEGRRVRKSNRVSIEQAVRASDWCDYLLSHARRIYSLIDPELNSAQTLALKIVEGKIGREKPFTAREVCLKGWTGLDSPEVVNLATQALIRAQWIREEKKETTRYGGRPSVQFTVNPKIWSLSREGFL